MAATRFHIPALDGVRGIALLIVVLAHTRPQVFPGGNIGVDLFFVLSGFLITSILLREHAATRTISIAKFYARRALRLLPALFLLVLVIVAYVAAFEREALPVTLEDAKSVILYYWNWRFAGSYPTGEFQPAFSHLWSLSVEEQFYILWPFAILLASPSRVFIPMLMVGILAPAVARLILWESGPSLPLYFRTDLRFDSLMWGALGAWLILHRQVSVPPIAGLVALVCFIGLARFDLLSDGTLYCGGYSAILALATLAIVASCGAPSILRSVLEWSPLRWTGKISYGLYLWHVPLFQLCEQLPFSQLQRNSVAILATFAVASASFYGMERYFLAMKPGHGGSRMPENAIHVEAGKTGTG